MSSKIAVFGDLHLSNRSEDPARRAFYQQLKKLSQENYSHILFMGDIFDLMVGPKAFWKLLHKEFFELLKLFDDKNVSLIWLEGNHDFHIKNLFKEFSHVQIIEEDYDLLLNQKKLYLSHGDKVNPEDRAYMRWRGITKSKLFRNIIDLIPSKLGEVAILPLAEGASKSSRKRSRESLGEPIKQRYLDFAHFKISQGYTGVFLGHNHSYSFEKLNSKSFYLNLGAPDQASFKFASWNLDSEEWPQIHTVNFT